MHAGTHVQLVHRFPHVGSRVEAHLGSGPAGNRRRIVISRICVRKLQTRDLIEGPTSGWRPNTAYSRHTRTARSVRRRGLFANQRLVGEAGYLSTVVFQEKTEPSLHGISNSRILHSLHHQRRSISTYQTMLIPVSWTIQTRRLRLLGHFNHCDGGHEQAKDLGYPTYERLTDAIVVDERSND